MAQVFDHSSKHRLQRTLDKQSRRKRAAAQNPDHREWLARHVERQGGLCAYCGMPLLMSTHQGQAGQQASLEHIIALSRGGEDSEANTLASCAPCNQAKGVMPAAAFRGSAFLRERKAFVAALMAKKPVIVEVVRKRPWKKP